MLQAFLNILIYINYSDRIYVCISGEYTPGDQPNQQFKTLYKIIATGKIKTFHSNLKLNFQFTCKKKFIQFVIAVFFFFNFQLKMQTSMKKKNFI